MNTADLIFTSGITMVALLMGVFVTWMFNESDEKTFGISIPDPKKEPIRVFTNLPKEPVVKEKAGPIKRPTAEDLELRQRTKEEKEQSEAFGKAVGQYTK